DLHTLTLTHGSLGTSGIAPIEALFNRGPLAAPGGKDAVNANGWNVQEGYAVTTVASMRMIVNLADLDKSRWINLTGASGHAFHDNYWDQAELWARDELLPMRSDRESVTKAAVHVLRLRPSSEGARLAHGQPPQTLAGQAVGGPLLADPLQGPQQRLAREHERAPVHGGHPLGAQVQEGPHGLRRVEVRGLHRPRRLVGADRQQRQVEAGVAGADPGEPFAVAGVAGEVHR